MDVELKMVIAIVLFYTMLIYVMMFMSTHKWYDNVMQKVLRKKYKNYSEACVSCKHVVYEADLLFLIGPKKSEQKFAKCRHPDIVSMSADAVNFVTVNPVTGHEQRQKLADSYLYCSTMRDQCKKDGQYEKALI
jgi:hypothetical protein